MAELSTRAERERSGHKAATRVDRFCTSASEWEEELGLSSRWTITGIALLALGAFVVYRFGTDIRRRLKTARI